MFHHLDALNKKKMPKVDFFPDTMLIKSRYSKRCRTKRYFNNSKTDEFCVMRRHESLSKISVLIASLMGRFVCLPKTLITVR